MARFELFWDDKFKILECICIIEIESKVLVS